MMVSPSFYTYCYLYIQSYDSTPIREQFCGILYNDATCVILLTFISYFKVYTRVGTLIMATIYLQLIQNRYMFRSFTVLQCSHQHCVQPVASDVEVEGYL